MKPILALCLLLLPACEFRYSSGQVDPCIYAKLYRECMSLAPDSIVDSAVDIMARCDHQATAVASLPANKQLTDAGLTRCDP